MDNFQTSLTHETYASPGCCIYCRSDGGSGRLRDEHIIPYSLGGNAVILRASCATCEAVTSYLEGVVGRPIFGPMRAYYEIQKRTKRHREQVLSLTFETKNGAEVREIPVREAPPFLMLRPFAPPGILDGRPPEKVLKQLEPWVWYSHDFIDYMENLRHPGDKSWSIDLVFNGGAFARFIAKVVHCFAVARFGLEGFKPLLPRLILGSDANIGFLIGGHAPPSAPEHLPAGRIAVKGHEVTMFQVANDVTGHRLLIATVRLFPFTGAPTYCAVVGEPGPAIIEQLR